MFILRIRSIVGAFKGGIMSGYKAVKIKLPQIRLSNVSGPISSCGLIMIYIFNLSLINYLN